MNVSIITPVYGTRLPMQVKHQLGPNDEWIIIDNYPEPLINYWGDKRIKVYHEPEPGAYKARTLALKKAKNDHLIFIDSDCKPRHDWLVRLKQKIPGNCIIAGKVVTTTGNTWVEKYDSLTATPQDLWKPGKELCMGNAYIFRPALTITGGFQRESRSGPDKGLVPRLLSIGSYYVYDKNIIVYHPPRKTFKSILQKIKRSAISSRRQDPPNIFFRKIITKWLPWFAMVKRIWRSNYGVPEKIVFLLMHEYTRLYYLYHYLKGGKEPLR